MRRRLMPMSRPGENNADFADAGAGTRPNSTRMSASLGEPCKTSTGRCASRIPILNLGITSGKNTTSLQRRIRTFQAYLLSRTILGLLKMYLRLPALTKVETAVNLIQSLDLIKKYNLPVQIQTSYRFQTSPKSHRKEWTYHLTLYLLTPDPNHPEPLPKRSQLS